MSYVCVSLEHVEISQSSRILKIAAEVLMASPQQVVLPAPLTPPEGNELWDNQKMNNNIFLSLLN